MRLRQLLLLLVQLHTASAYSCARLHAVQPRPAMLRSRAAVPLAFAQKDGASQQPQIVTEAQEKLKLEAEAEADSGLGIGERAQRYWEGLLEFAGAFKVPPIDEDTMEEAKVLKVALDAAEANPSQADWGRLANLTGSYYGASFDRVWSNPAVRRPSTSNP